LWKSAVLISLLGTLSTTSAAAQECVSTAIDAGRFYLSGSFSLSFGMGAESNPVASFRNRRFYGSLDWPEVNALVGGGLFVSQRIGIGGELTLPLSHSVIIQERVQHPFEREELSSRDRNREQLASVFARAHFTRGTIMVQPLGGLTISRARQSLTDRAGTYFYHAGRLRVARPDTSEPTTRPGLVGGVDVLRRGAGDLWVVGGARLHLLSGTALQRPVPDLDNWRQYVNAGVLWRSGKH
jgi:hypothetical protein